MKSPSYKNHISVRLDSEAFFVPVSSYKTRVVKRKLFFLNLPNRNTAPIVKLQN